MNLFRRAECYLILAQFCFCKEDTDVASRLGHLGLRLSGPCPQDLGIPFGPSSLPLGYTWAIRWDRCL